MTVLYPNGDTRSSKSGHSGPEVESSARGSSESGNSLGSSARANAIPSATCIRETACVWVVSLRLISIQSLTLVVRGPVPLQDHCKIAEMSSRLNPVVFRIHPRV